MLAFPDGVSVGRRSFHMDAREPDLLVGLSLSDTSLQAQASVDVGLWAQPLEHVGI